MNYFLNLIITLVTVKTRLFVQTVCLVDDKNIDFVSLCLCKSADPLNRFVILVLVRVPANLLS